VQTWLRSIWRFEGEQDEQQNLEQLWVAHQNTVVEDTVVPDLPEQPVLPSLSDTELGKAAQHNACVTVSSARNLTDEALSNLIASLQQHQEARNVEATSMIDGNTSTEAEVRNLEAVHDAPTSTEAV
jgi:hypothetical protein